MNRLMYGVRTVLCYVHLFFITFKYEIQRRDIQGFNLRTNLYIPVRFKAFFTPFKCKGKTVQ